MQHAHAPVVNVPLLLLAELNQQTRQLVFVPGALLSARPLPACQYSGYTSTQGQRGSVIKSVNGILIGDIIGGAIVQEVGQDPSRRCLLFVNNYRPQPMGTS